MKKIFVSAIALLATLSLSAQDFTAIYNEAATAYSSRNFQAAADNFQKLIDQGMEAPEAADLVATAKATLPKCYYQMGGAAFQQKNFEAALQNFAKSAELADLYGDNAQMQKANAWVANVYQVQGGEAFNAKDYAKAAEIFVKGYEANPRNTDMALNLAMSYCEMAVANNDMAQYEKGMDVYENVASMKGPKYDADAAKAREMMTLYTNNMVAKMQQAGDNDGIIAMADTLLVKNPANPVALKVRLQAYADKKDYAKVIELGEEAAAAQLNEEDRGYVYLALGAAYNAKEMKPQAIAAFEKVTEGPALEPAKAALTELTKK